MRVPQFRSTSNVQTVQVLTFASSAKRGPADLSEVVSPKKAKVISSLWEETDWYLADNISSPQVRPNKQECFRCPLCARQYLKVKVSEHMTQRHNPEDSPRYLCQQPGCTMSYCKLNALRTHHRTDLHQGYSVVYEVETETSSRSALLESSMEVIALPADEHETVRYKCSFGTCLKTYSTKYRCQAHVASHMEKPLVCPDPDCHKVYSTRDSLNQHKRFRGHIGVLSHPSNAFADNGVQSVQEVEEMTRKKAEGSMQGKDVAHGEEEHSNMNPAFAESLRCEYETTTQFHEAVQELLAYFQELL